MDYWGVVRESWATVRSASSLWWLGLVSAVQLFLYTLIVLIAIVPLVALPRFALALQAAAENPGAGQLAVLQAAQWIAGHSTQIVVGIVGLFAIWVAVGVVDVAAQVGLVTQTDSMRMRRRPSFLQGLRDGFRYWWRAVALLAIAALPALVYLLAMALVSLFTVALPLYSGSAPNPALAVQSNLALSPLSTLVTLVSIPLGVLVLLAIRFAVLDDQEWRPAVRSAWQLLRARLADVAILYVILFGVLLLVSLVIGIVAFFLGIIGAVGAVAALSAQKASTTTYLGAGFAIAAVLVLLAVPVQVGVSIFRSVFWTLGWRRLTTPVQRSPFGEPIYRPARDAEPPS